MLRTRLLLAAGALAGAAVLSAQAGPAKSAPGVDRFDQALARRADGRQSPKDVRIDASWRRGTEIVDCRVYGTGVGVWRDKTQFSLAHELVLALLRDLQGARFGAMPRFFGSEEGGDEEEKEHEKEKQRERQKEKVYLRGSLSVRVDTEWRRVAQYMEGDQDKGFAALVGRVLAASEKAAANGQGAASLSEGLAAVASGKLAPETLQIMVQRRAAAAGGDGQPGARWLMRLDGRRVLDRTWSADGTESVRLLRLSEADFRKLVGLVQASDLAKLPRNLYSRDNVRVDVRVLDRRADLSARRYAGKTAQSLGAPQEAFDRVDAALAALHERAVREGGAAPGAE